MPYACAEKRKNGGKRIFLTPGWCQCLLGANLETAVAATELRTDKLLLGGPVLQQGISPGCVCVLCAAVLGQVIISSGNETCFLLMYRGVSCNSFRREADGCCIHH